MIKSTELRIGNYVLQTEGTTEVKVENLDSKNINGLPGSSFEPVRLNDAIMERCGFERGTDSTSRPAGPYHKGVCEVTVHNEFYAPEYFQPNGTELPHLHQLQNLYFALTGAELEVKM